LAQTGACDRISIGTVAPRKCGVRIHRVRYEDAFAL
jgi:hypothetical protein